MNDPPAEKALMTVYYATRPSGGKNRRQITGRPPIIFPIRRNLLRIHIYNLLGLISLSPDRDDCLLTKSPLVRNRRWAPEIARAHARERRIERPIARQSKTKRTVDLYLITIIRTLGMR